MIMMTKELDDYVMEVCVEAKLASKSISTADHNAKDQHEHGRNEAHALEIILIVREIWLTFDMCRLAFGARLGVVGLGPDRNHEVRCDEERHSQLGDGPWCQEKHHAREEEFAHHFDDLPPVVIRFVPRIQEAVSLFAPGVAVELVSVLAQDDPIHERASNWIDHNP